MNVGVKDIVVFAWEVANVVKFTYHGHWPNVSLVSFISLWRGFSFWQYDCYNIVGLFGSATKNFPADHVPWLYMNWDQIVLINGIAVLLNVVIGVRPLH